MPSSNVVYLPEHIGERSVLEHTDPVARFAFDMCELTFRQKDWRRFDYWFRIARSQGPGWAPSRRNATGSLVALDDPAHVQEQLDQTRLADAHGGLAWRHPLALAHALLWPVVEFLIDGQRVDVDQAKR